MLHLHGGGYVIQSVRTYATMWKMVANAVPAVVVSLDYRMAPEHPYPAAVDDAAAAVRWMRAHAGEIGGDGARIALAGESAGGGLAPATALRLAADGDEQVRGAAIHTPWLDLTMSSESINDLGPDDPMLDAEMLAYWRDLYVPEKASRREPEASPLFADLSSFPPAFVAVGAIDPLCAEGEQFAAALRGRGATSTSSGTRVCRTSSPRGRNWRRCRKCATCRSGRWHSCNGSCTHSPGGYRSSSRVCEVSHGW